MSVDKLQSLSSLKSSKPIFAVPPDVAQAIAYTGTDETSIYIDTPKAVAYFTKAIEVNEERKMAMTVLAKIYRQGSPKEHGGCVASSVVFLSLIPILCVSVVSPLFISQLRS